MADGPLIGVKACLFDAYGTLFDFASAARNCRDIPPGQIGPLTNLWRDKQLQYTWLRAVQGLHADFWQVTSDALDYSLETLGVGGKGLNERLMQLYLELEPFPEVPEVLARLKRSGVRMAVLSNGSPKMLEAVVIAANLGHYFDAVLSVEEVGVLQAASQGLSACRRSARRARRRDLISVLERLGRLCCERIWDAGGVVQSLWSAARAIAWRT